MKIFLSFYVLCLSLYSCSADSTVPDNYDHQGKWELARTQTNIAGAEKTEDLEFRESYLFRHNGTFLKTRKYETSEETAQGTYKLVKRPWTGPGEPLLSLDLKFEEDSPLIANCVMEPVEHLNITSEYLLVNTWIACDGNLMEYEKVEQTEN